MNDQLRSEVTSWCETHITFSVAEQLDSGELSPLKLYHEVCLNGWMSYCDLFTSQDNFSCLVEVCKLINSYSGVLGNMICVNAASAMLLNVFGDANAKLFASNIINGEKLSAFSLTEPQAGTDVMNIQCSAELVDDQWEINGEKYLATGVQLADSVIVAVRTRLDTGAKAGTSLLLVPVNSEGLSISPIPKMASGGYASCHLKFSACKVDKAALVGGENKAWPAMAMAGGVERVLVAACCVGLCKRVGEYLLDYAHQRKVGGNPIYELVNIRHQIVDIAIKVRAGEALVEKAVGALVSGANATNAVCSAKTFASQIQQEVSMTAMQVMGGRAYLKAFPLERWLREGLLSLWAGGTNDLQRNLMSRSPFVD
jgi:alkylation response protein AidB-like acyl-CoA dehydrogenase